MATLSRPANYDGDYRTDAAFVRAANGLSAEAQRSAIIRTKFGLACDKPAPADYDGDGKADIGVWRGSNKTFYSIRRSSGTLQTATFSNRSTAPVNGDYDGDGRADYAISNTANWIILKSSNIQF